MKLFTTKNIEIVKYCQEYFSFALPNVLWAKRVSKFESSFQVFLSALYCVVLIVFVMFTLLPCILVNKIFSYEAEHVCMITAKIAASVRVGGLKTFPACA